MREKCNKAIQLHRVISHRRVGWGWGGGNTDATETLSGIG